MLERKYDIMKKIYSSEDIKNKMNDEPTPKKKRGRPSKAELEARAAAQITEAVSVATTAKKRGRPKKVTEPSKDQIDLDAVVAEAMKLPSTVPAEEPKPQKKGFQALTSAQRRKMTADVFGTTFEKQGVKNALKFYETRECSNELIRNMAQRYIQVQTDRIRVGGQRTAMVDSFLEEEAAKQGVDKKEVIYSEAQMIEDHPELMAINAALSEAEWVESNTASLLDAVTQRSCLTQYLRQIKGVGPVVAGLIAANIDITRFNYPSNLVSYAGLTTVNKWYSAAEAKKKVEESFAVTGSRILTSDAASRLEDAMDILKEFSTIEVGGVTVNRFNNEIDEAYAVLLENADMKEVNSKFVVNFIKIVDLLSDKEKCNEANLTKVSEEIIQCGKLIPESIDVDIPQKFIDDLVEAREVLLGCKVDNTDISDEFLQDLAIRTHRGYNTVLGYTTVVDESTGEVTRSYSELLTRLTKRPFNAALKRALFLFQDQVIKRHNDPKSLYGRLYNEFLDQEHRIDAEGGHAAAAAGALEKKNFGKSTKAYQSMKNGHLSDGHMMNRALRKVKVVFLNHIFEAAKYFEDPTAEIPRSYVFDVLKHKDYIAPEVDYRKFYEDFYKDIPKEK